MAADPLKDPLASLSLLTPQPVAVRPSIPARSASSRTLPTSTHPRVTIHIPAQQIPADILDGVKELARSSVRGNVRVVEEPIPGGSKGAFVWVLGFRKDPKLERGLRITSNYDDFTAVPSGEDFEVEISYNRPIEAFRGLGHVLGVSRGLSSFKHPDAPELDTFNDEDVSFEDGGIRWSGKVGDELRREEQCLFETVGVMVDCSRNGVMLVSGVKMLLRNLAMSGTNVLQLYCEDTYQIPGEPFFGYFRGPYTEAELREIDDYAFALIQTLGHLGQMLQWNKYAYLRDTAEVILADAVETYAFIEKMIAAISKPLRSKRIHIGMDEAYGVSEGRYRQCFGYKDSTKVNNALSTYYDLNQEVPQLTGTIPDNVDFVFWSTDWTTYAEKIKHHWKLAGKSCWMASGVWSWSRFWTALPFTFATVKAALKAAKDPTLGVKSVMTTIWGDEGNECDLYSTLPGILYHAEQAYTREDEVDAALLKKKFDGITGGDFDDYLFASKLDDTQPESQPIDTRTRYTPNLAKYLLWEEPFFSFLSPQYNGFDLESHYLHVATYLEQALSTDFSSMNLVAVPHSISDFPANRRLRLPYLLARVLALKCHLRARLAEAYKTDDRAELVALAGPEPESRMSRLRELVVQLHKTHRANWMEVYKPFGFEVLDLRYGGLRARLETMHGRLIAYLDPEDTSVTRVEELEVDLQTAYPNQGPNLMLDYARASRPQYI
ncbi:hexosaminidase, glycoside hydrolase family 20 protein [Pseudohyphozyma bogoriensis]|nr:hexosaminidase, glycoside hydrolase family 20 protein [Pseudohyphozyma bogoriensis]